MDYSPWNHSVGHDRATNTSLTRKQKRVSLVWLEIVILDRVDPDGKWSCSTE